MIKKYLLYFLTVIGLMLPLTGCEDTNVLIMADATIDAVNAATLSDKDVRSIAQRAAMVSDQQNSVAPSGSLYDKRLGRLVGNYDGKGAHSFNYKVYLTDQVNAFAMADGTIRINSGLMDLMNDRELLFVIGHEMGHVVQEHSKKQLILAYTTSAIRKGLASQENEVGQLARSLFGAFTEQLTHAQFSQYEELQADSFGVKFINELGYDDGGAVSALNKLADLANNNHTFLSSHPEPRQRAEKIERGEFVEDDSSLLATSVAYVKKAITMILTLISSIISWILSFL